jgi:hypothetical protein
MNETKSTLPAKIRGSEITRFNGLCQTNDRSSAHGAARPDPSGH